MKIPNRLVICLLAGLVGLLPLGTFAQPLVSLTVVATFDYPGTGNSTTPFGINQGGDIAGDFADPSNATRGFIRFRDGSFSAPLVDPNDTANFTRGLGINSATVTGQFFNVADNVFHGFFLNGGVFTQFDFGANLSTNVVGINDAGDFVGIFGSSTQPNQPFVNIGGTSTVIGVPGATTGEADGIDNLDRVVGVYSSDAVNFHGFLRQANGSLNFPIDFPGSAQTLPRGINDRGWIVGRYINPDASVHGFFLKLPGTFITFDYPGAIETSLNGINNAGLISGRYTDGAGLRHGFVARVRR